MIKSTFILANILSVLFMAGALAAFTAQPAASQTAKKLKCRGCVKSKQIGNNQIRGSDIKDGEIGLGDLGFNPATQEELDNTDTLSDLTCADGEVPKMVGGAWTCAADADSAGDISLLLTKIDNLARLQASGASAYVFLTSDFFTGNLGGVSNADFRCQTLADAAGLPGTYFAWIADSDPASAPDQRFTQAPFGYVLPPSRLGGVAELGEVAMSWNDLINGSLNLSINVDELGDFHSGPIAVWTNVDASGGPGSGPHCDNWTSATGGGSIGVSDAFDSTWTKFGEVPCSPGARLYCFGQ